jgi:hypothetical protein
MPEVRVDELVVFKPDKAGLAATEAAITKLESLRQNSLKKSSDLTQQIAKLMEATRVPAESLTREAGKLELAQERVVNAIENIVEQYGLEGTEQEKILKLMIEQVTKATDIKKIKDIERKELKNVVEMEKKRRTNIMQQLGLEKEIYKIEGKTEGEIKKQIADQKALTQFRILGVKWANQAVTVTEVQGRKFEEVKGITGMVKRETGEWMSKLGTMAIWAGVIAAVYKLVKGTANLTGNAMAMSMYIKEGAVEMGDMINLTGTMAKNFGMTSEEADKYLKSLAAAGMQLPEIAATYEDIYSRQVLWNISTDKQVELIRGVQHNLQATAKEASDMLTIAALTRKDFADWSVEEVVGQIGDMTKSIRGGKLETLMMTALFRTVAETSERVAGNMNFFHGMSRSAREAILGMVGSMGDMSESSMVFMSRFMQFPPEIKTAVDRIQYMKEGFKGLGDWQDQTNTKASAFQMRLDAMLKTLQGVGKEEIMRGGTAGEIKFRIEHMLTAGKLDFGKEQTEVAKKVYDAVSKGQDIDKNTQKILEDNIKKAAETQKDPMMNISKEAAKITLLTGDMKNWLNRLYGLIALAITHLPGMGGTLKEIKEAQVEYGKTGVELYRDANNQLWEVNKQGIATMVSDERQETLAAAGVKVSERGFNELGKIKDKEGDDVKTRKSLLMGAQKEKVRTGLKLEGAQAGDWPWSKPDVVDVEKYSAQQKVVDAAIDQLDKAIKNTPPVPPAAGKPGQPTPADVAAGVSPAGYPGGVTKVDIGMVEEKQGVPVTNVSVDGKFKITTGLSGKGVDQVVEKSVKKGVQDKHKSSQQSGKR